MRSGTVVGASRNIGHAARLVGSDAADALMRDGNRVHAGSAGSRIVDHRIAAGVIGPFLILPSVALLGAQIDFAAGADIVASVDFCLGRESDRKSTRLNSSHT